MPPFSMTLRRLLTAPAILCAGAVLISACDGGAAPPASVVFQGVTYHALGQAELSLRAGALEVDQVGSSGADGVRVNAADGVLDSLEVLIESITLGSGANWGLTVYGDVAGARTALGRVWADDIGGGRNSIKTEFAGSLGLDSLIFEYLLDGALVARSPALPVGTPRSTLEASGGTTDKAPQSVHAVREGGVVVIGTDYRDGEAVGGGGTQALGCTVALIDVPFQTEPVCADFVRARPLLPPTGGLMPPAQSAEIQGRLVGRFVITSGVVD